MKISSTSVFTILLLVVCSPAFAQLGIFDQSADWGPRTTYKAEGNVSVSTDGLYTIQGNGDDIWNNDDEGFFVFKNLSGSWSLSANVKWVDRGGDDVDNSLWAKIGIMIRESGAAANSRNYFATLRAGSDTSNMGDLTSVQWRSNEGGSSSNVEMRTTDNLAVNDQGNGVWLRVSRIVDAGMVLSEYSYDGTTWNFGQAQVMSFPDTVAYGLAIANHLDNELLAKAIVQDVKLENTVPPVGNRTTSLDDPVYVGGSPITVSLTVGGGSGTLQVDEIPPAGWTISSISNGGTENGGTITWNLTAAAVLTYVVTPPTGATGEAAFSGKVNDTPIVGTSNVSAPDPIGIFDHHLDIGGVGAAGSAEYDSDLERYYITGSGADIWDTADEFQFVYKKMTGAFSLQAYVVAFNDTGANEWSKAGIMVRDNLTAGSPHFNAIIRGSDAQYDSQWRAAQDGSSSNLDLRSGALGDIRIVRNGNYVNAFYTDSTGEWVEDTNQVISLTDPVYLGFSVTSHDDGLYAVGEYDTLELILYPFQVYKTISETEVSQGGSTDVQLTLMVRDGETPNITVKETYSNGLTISNLSSSAGQVADDTQGNITLTLTDATGTITLNYTVNVPSDFAGSFVDLTGTFDDGDGYTGSTGANSLPVVALNLGIFQGHQDIGSTVAQGNVKVDEDSYQVVGSGADIWGTADAFHYLWMKVSGDFAFSIDNPYIGATGTNPSTNDWMKMGIMARQDLTAPSAYVIGLMRASDQYIMEQYRLTSGVDAAENGITSAPSVWNPNYDPALSDGVNKPTLEQVNLGGTMKMKRDGDLFTFGYVLDGEDVDMDSVEVVFTDPIYLGISVTSHEAGATAQGLFTNPQFTGTTVSVGSWMLY